MSVRNRVDRLLRYFEKDFLTHNRIEVSKSALAHNLELFRDLTNQKIIPVLKGNAYGHGIEIVSRALEKSSIPYIAVDGYFEALRIREVSQHPVLVMGSILPINYAQLKYNNFAFVVHDEAAIRALGQTQRLVNIHLECNTGMNRYGASIKDVKNLTEIIKSYKNLNFEGVMSHLADSDGSVTSTVEEAIQEFDLCIEAIHSTGVTPTLLHLAQTAGSIRVQSKYANCFRLGLGLYGLNPFSAEHSLHSKLENLKPALQLISTLTQISDLKKGDKVSYNYTFTAPHNMKIGVLPLGYYEGVNRSLSNRGSLKLADNFVPIVGRICMNHTIINLGKLQALVGDEVIVYSNNPKDKNSLERIAEDNHLFVYELLTSLNSDVRRLLID